MLRLIGPRKVDQSLQLELAMKSSNTLMVT
jgi:hypothetical protein